MAGRNVGGRRAGVDREEAPETSRRHGGGPLHRRRSGLLYPSSDHGTKPISLFSSYPILYARVRSISQIHELGLFCSGVSSLWAVKLHCVWLIWLKIEDWVFVAKMLDLGFGLLGFIRFVRFFVGRSKLGQGRWIDKGFKRADFGAAQHREFASGSPRKKGWIFNFLITAFL